MEFYFDFTAIDAFLADGPFLAMWRIFIAGGWVPVLLAMLYIGWQGWIAYRQEKYMAKWSFVMLAIDIPKENEQAVKAVENIFVALAGTRSGGDFIDKYWTGKVQESFSFEIASLEGYIQFYVRTVTHFRDVVEAAVYAQYPNADIREVPDYTQEAPDNFPSDEYDMWGSDIVLTNKEAYPIRTYFFFEDQLKGEFKDPMANFLESLSRLGPGEQFWVQIIVLPIDSSWKERANGVVQKLIGAKASSKKRIIDHVLDAPLGVLEYAGDQVFSRERVAGSGDVVKDPNKLMYLTPGDRGVLEAIQKKMAKIGYATKIRVVYLAKKEVYNAAKAVSGFFGAINQFTTLDMNGFRPHATFRTNKYRLFQKRRLVSMQKRVMSAYKARGTSGGGDPYVLCVEELATIYHFPEMTVKAQGVRKMEAKRGEAPFSLPTQNILQEVIPVPEVSEAEEKDASEVAPPLEEIIIDPDTIASDEQDVHFSPVQNDRSSSHASEEDIPDATGTKPEPPGNLPL